MGESARQRFDCPVCGQSCWLFGVELQSCLCPHCGSALGTTEFDGRRADTDDVPVRVEFVDVDDVNYQMHVESINLDDVKGDRRIQELIPESVTRENCLVPVAVGMSSITVAIPDDLPSFPFELVDKLRFMLNREVHVRTASRHAIMDAIEEWYTG